MHLPEDFINLIHQSFELEEADKLLNSIGNDRVLSIRYNRDKCEKYHLQRVDKHLVPVPWCTSGFFLAERCKFTFDPLFHAGAYYVQEASSMFLEQVYKQYLTGDIVALDLCAAPGGKSTLLRELMSSNSLLMCNEVVAKRAQILAENMQKWGDSHVIVSNNKPEDFTPLESLFDLVLADVPCSGEGMFRKDDGAISAWSLDGVRLCQSRQKKILDSIWPTIKPGGFLVYSTCTFNQLENEDNVAYMMENYGAISHAVEVDQDSGIYESLFSNGGKGYRFLPHLVKGEGLFMAVLQKPMVIGDSLDCKLLHRGKEKLKRKKGKGITSIAKIEQAVEGWLLASDNYKVALVEDYVYAFPKNFMPYLNLLKQLNFHLLLAGVPLATLKGDNLIPKHGLAMSNELNSASFNSVQVTYEEAVRYLQREAIAIPATAPKGYLLVTYKSCPIGFIKHLGNRSNNLYPNEWRIRSRHNELTEESFTPLL